MAQAQKTAPAGGGNFDVMKYVNEAGKLAQRAIEHEVTQLRAPLVLAAGVGRLNFSVAWMFLFVQFAMQLYTIQRGHRLPRPHRQSDTKEGPLRAAERKEEKPAAGTDKATLRSILIGVEMYFHLIIGSLVAFYIGCLSLDLLFLLPVIETVVFVEKQLLLLRLKVTGTHATVAELDVKEEEHDVVIEDFESFKAMLSTTPIHVDTEWMNMLLAQFWQLYATWSEEFVRSQIEFYTNGLGLKCENSTLGKIPITLRNVTGKRRRVFVGSSQQARSDEDLIYDLDLHIEWAAIPCIQLNFAGIRLTVNSLFLSGVMRGELKWFEISEEDADYLSPQFPNLTGITIYFTERPTLQLSLSVMGLFDLLSLPIIDWIVQKFVVDNIVCGLMGPQGDKICPMVLYDLKDDMIAARDRARGVGGDLDAVSKRFRPCQLVVTVLNAQDVPAMDGSFGTCDPYCKLRYGVRDTPQWEGEEQRTKEQKQTLEPVWGEKFEWFTNSDEDELEITMYDWDQVGSDDEIGTWKTTLGDLRRELKLHLKKVAVPHKVFLSGEFTDPAPQLNLSIQFRNFTAHIEGCEDGTALKDVPVLEGVGGILRISLRRCEKIPHGDDDVYVVFYVGSREQYGERLKTDLEGNPSSCEQVRPKELKRLQTATSDTKNNQTNPEWAAGDAEWEFKIGSASEVVVSALIWDKDVGEDDLLGSTVFEIKNLAARNKGARFLTSDEHGKQSVVTADGSVLCDTDGAPTSITFICDFLPDEEQVEKNKSKRSPPAAPSVEADGYERSPRQTSSSKSSTPRETPRRSSVSSAKSPRKG